MERKIQLRIFSTQQYTGEDAESTELFTEGTMREENGTWFFSYEESALTGLPGTTTTFAVTPEKITLTRTGALHSQMEFALGREHHSLYDMGFGTLMIAVRPTQMQVSLNENGGFFEVLYAICVEGSSAGEVKYRIEVKPQTL